jgi:hypothetical protein
MSQRSRALQYLLAGHIASQSDRSHARRICQIMVPFKRVVRIVVPIHALATLVLGLFLLPWIPNAPLVWLLAQPLVILQYVVLTRQNVVQ